MAVILSITQVAIQVQLWQRKVAAAAVETGS